MSVEYEKVNEIVEEIERIIENTSHGWRNKEALFLLRGQIRNLKSFKDNYLDNIAESIMDYAEILYSERKHKRYGIDFLLSYIYGDCSKIQSYAGYLNRKNNKTS